MIKPKQLKHLTVSKPRVAFDIVRHPSSDSDMLRHLKNCRIRPFIIIIIIIIIIINMDYKKTVNNRQTKQTLTVPRCISTVLLSRLTTLSCDSPFFIASNALRYITSYTVTAPHHHTLVQQPSFHVNLGSQFPP